MRFSERISNRMVNSVSHYSNRYLFLRKNLIKMLSLLLFGFLIGNMFVSVLYTIQEYFIWCLPRAWSEKSCIYIYKCIGIWLLLFIELTSYLTYHAQKRAFFSGVLVPRSIIKVHLSIFRFVNMFKIGLMLGFFVDAFKVGS